MSPNHESGVLAVRPKMLLIHKPRTCEPDVKVLGIKVKKARLQNIVYELEGLSQSADSH